jgi:hypothetical protein
MLLGNSAQQDQRLSELLIESDEDVLFWYKRYVAFVVRIVFRLYRTESIG